MLDKNSYGCEPLTDLSYPVVLLQGRQSSGDGFIESFRGDLYGVLNVSNVFHCDGASSQNQTPKDTIFVFCSLHSGADMNSCLSAHGKPNIDTNFRFHNGTSAYEISSIDEVINLR